MKKKLKKMKKFITTKLHGSENQSVIVSSPSMALNTTALTTKITISTTSSSSPAAQIKMCGYLKKKRNKMGGWRKMYFILQNQLLLSYSSKEDYEKKLAPFKDIINLVPGTVIIPTTGPRFTIETNSKVLYTFRCDDHKTCSEWITALLDSLKGDNINNNMEKKYNLQTGYKFLRRPQSSLSSSSSSGSSSTSGREDRMPMKNMNMFNINHKMGRYVRMPIGGSTARLLERGGLNKYQILTINEVEGDELLAEDDGEADHDDVVAAADGNEKVMRCISIKGKMNNKNNNNNNNINFRLHENLEKVNQSLDVCRINSMFNGKKLSKNKKKMDDILEKSGEDEKLDVICSSKDINQNLIHFYEER